MLYGYIGAHRRSGVPLIVRAMRMYSKQERHWVKSICIWDWRFVGRLRDTLLRLEQVIHVSVRSIQQLLLFGTQNSYRLGSAVSMANW